MTKYIIGAGGNRERNRKPTREPDTLNSRQFATLQDLVSEGEIEGFATPSKAGLTRGTETYNNASLKDVILDNTPVLTASASNTSPISSDFNFQDVELTPRFGTASQSHVAGIENVGASSPSTVGVEVTASGGGVTRQITNTQIDAARITVSFPAIQKTTDKGDVLGSSVSLQILIQYASETSGTVVISDTVKGRTADLYQKDYRVDFDRAKITAGTAFPLEITVKRITADAPSGGQLTDAFSWATLTEIIDDKQTYANSAYMNLRFDSEQFSNIPQRAFRIRGVKTRIPSANTNSTTATYTQSTTTITISSNSHGLAVGDSIIFDATSGAGVDGTYQIATVPDANSFTFTAGNSQTVTTSNCTYKITPHVDLQTGRINYPNGYIFNGTMGAAQWNSCPSMSLLDLLTTERYGFGTHILDTDIDFYSFVEASKYSNELVSDGFGGQEARFSLNVNIQASQEAFSLINNICGVMRAFPIWSGGKISLAQDRPTDPSYLFSLANVTEGGFTYTGSSLKKRSSVANVAYFNMDSREIDYEVVEDTAAQAKLGIIKKDIKGFGITSRGQAQRAGKSVLFSEQQESEIVTFSVSIESGAIIRPGAVVQVNDPVRAGERRAGRISAATTTQITVDSNDDLANFIGNNKKCTVILPDGSIETKNTLSVSPNDNKIITLDSALSQVPNVNSIWLLSSTGTGGLEPQTFRVIGVEEDDDGINYKITALTYLAGKYANIEQGIALPARNISLLNALRDPPANVTVDERTVVINAVARTKLIISWVSVTGVSQYLVQYRFNNTNWVSRTVLRTDFEILDTVAGTYEIKVYSLNAGLNISATSTDVTFNAVGKTDPPSDVQNLTIEPVTNKLIRLRWLESTDADVIHGGKVYVRHSNKTDGSGTFQNSVDLIEALAGNTTEAVVPSLDGEYILKFRDDQGNFSTGETSVILDLPDLIDSQQILADREDTDSTPFSGTKTNCSVSGGGLELTDPTVVKTGTYSQSGTTITITSTSHGIAASERLQFNFTTGTAISGLYDIVSVPNANTLTITSTKSITTSGNVSIDRGLRATYDFANTIDLGGVFSLNLKRLIQSIGFATGGQTITATYTQSGTTVTVTSNSHGRSQDDYVDFDALTGAGVDGVYRITAVATNTFTFTSGTSQTVSSSNCTFAFVNTIDTLIPAGTFWDDYAQNGNFDGPQVNDTSASLSVRSTTGNPSSSPTYTQFNTFANGTFKGRGFQFRVDLKSENTAHNISLQQLGIFAAFESRTERSYVSGGSTSTAPLSSGTSGSGLDVTFGSPFFVGTSSLGGANAFLPSVGITIQGAAAGEYFVLSSVTGTGFNIKILDSSNNPVNKQFTFQAVGYGKGG